MNTHDEELAHDQTYKTIANIKKLEKLIQFALDNKWILFIETDSAHCIEKAFPQFQQLMGGGRQIPRQHILEASTNPALIREADNLTLQILGDIRFVFDSTSHVFILIGPLGWVENQRNDEYAFASLRERALCARILWFNE